MSTAPCAPFGTGVVGELRSSIVFIHSESKEVGALGTGGNPSKKHCPVFKGKLLTDKPSAQSKISANSSWLYTSIYLLLPGRFKSRVYATSPPAILNRSTISTFWGDKTLTLFASATDVLVRSYLVPISNSLSYILICGIPVKGILKLFTQTRDVLSGIISFDKFVLISSDFGKESSDAISFRLFKDALI